MEWLLSALFSLLVTSIVGYIAYRKLKNDIWDTINDFGQQFAEKFNEMISPVVKKGFSLAGSLGGEAKATKELQNKLATEYINQKYGDIRMLADVLGFDVDVEGLLQEYGAPTVLKAVMGFANVLQGQGKGLNLNNLLGGKNPRQSGNVPSM